MSLTAGVNRWTKAAQETHKPQQGITKRDCHAPLGLVHLLQSLTPDQSGGYRNRVLSERLHVSVVNKGRLYKSREFCCDSSFPFDIRPHDARIFFHVM